MRIIAIGRRRWWLNNGSAVCRLQWVYSVSVKMSISFKYSAILWGILMSNEVLWVSATLTIRCGLRCAGACSHQFIITNVHRHHIKDHIEKTDRRANHQVLVNNLHGCFSRYTHIQLKAELCCAWLSVTRTHIFRITFRERKQFWWITRNNRGKNVLVFRWNENKPMMHRIRTKRMDK